MLIKADIFLRLSVQSAGEDSQTGVCSVEFQDIIFSQIMLIKADIFLRLSAQSAGEDSQTGVCSVEF